MRAFLKKSGAVLLFGAYLLGQNILGQTAELVVQTGHSWPVNFLMFSPDGRIMASGDGRTTKLWDVATGRELRTLDELQADYSIDYRRFRFTANSRFVVDGNRVTEIESGREVATFPSVVAAEAFLSDDATKFATTSGTYVRVWPLANGADTLFIYRTELATMNQKRMLFASFGKPIRIAKEQAENANSNVHSSYDPWAANRSGGANSNANANPRPPSRSDNAVYVFSLDNERQIARITGLVTRPKKILFSKDGSRLITVDDASIKVWNVDTGKLQASLTGDFKAIETILPNADSSSILFGIDRGDRRTEDFKLWNIERPAAMDLTLGRESSEGGLGPEFDFSPDGKSLAVSECIGSCGADVGISSVRILDAGTGREIKKLDLGRTLRSHYPVVFSPDSRNIAVGRYNEIELWDLESGRRLRTFEGFANTIYAASLSRDGTTIAESATKRPRVPPSGDAAVMENSTLLWPMITGREPKVVEGEIKYTGPYSSSGYALMSSYGQLINHHNRFLVTESTNYKGRWQEMTELQLRENRVYHVLDTQNASAREDLSGLMNQRNREAGFLLEDANVSPDGAKVALLINRDLAKTSGKAPYLLEMWSAGAKKPAWTAEIPWEGESNPAVHSVHFDMEGKFVKVGPLAFVVETGTPDILNPIGASPSTLPLDYGRTRIGNVVVGAWIGTGGVKLFDFLTRELKAELFWLNEDDWAVITPEGLWDASPGARRHMHYVVGLEPVSLDQTKDGYYVPGLLQKIFRGESLPKVKLFTTADLFPEVRFAPPSFGQKDLKIKLRNRGGGIGQVQILVNGKELIADARPNGFDPKTTEAELTASLEGAALVGDGTDLIEVIARNASGSLSNRGTAAADEFVTADPNAKREPPNIYAIVVGISEYTGDRLRLNYAAKDAEDFAKALEIGAQKLVGDPKKVHLRVLTSTGERVSAKFSSPDTKLYSATKADVERAFQDFKGAASSDVFIVYLAGHGVALSTGRQTNAPESSTYLYLTQEATTADPATLRLENTRKAMTFSGDELKELMKKNKAFKQVLILDTCAAGKVADSFIAKRDIPADQIDALERLKDNTGFFILMGSASDAVSYEAGEYGQGLLTRALLQGMQGEKLRLGEYADIELLFGYAKETVVQLAKNIGGIQRPETITPYARGSFDIGRFTSAERTQIKLPSRLPRILRPKLQNDKLRFDNLKLEPVLSSELRNLAYTAGRGDRAKIVYIDAVDVPDAILPSGGYTIEGDTLTITLVLVRNNEQFGPELKVKGQIGEKDALLRQLVEKIYLQVSRPSS